MKPFLLILTLSVLSSQFVYSQTVLLDTVHVDRFDKDASPYLVDGTVYVVNNLIIEPGVEVFGKEGSTHELVTAGGTIHAMGAPGDSIYFTGVHVLCYKEWDPELDGNQSTFQYCVFRNNDHYTKRLVVASMRNRTDTARNCSFYNNFNGLLTYDYGQGESVLENCVFENNTVAIILGGLSSTFSIDKSIITRNEYGIFAGVKKLVIRNCEISYNTGFGIHNQTFDNGQSHIGGAPEYCNKIFGNDSNIFTLYQEGYTLDASYNYWGTQDTAEIYKNTDRHITVLPLADENCLPIVSFDDTNPAIANTPSLTAYPNPSASAVQVQLAGYKHGAVEYEVFNLLGESVLYNIVESGSISLPGLPTGYYRIRATYNQTHSWTSFVVE